MVSYCIRTLLLQDEAGNAKVGKDISLYECKNGVVHAADGSKVVSSRFGWLYCCREEWTTACLFIERETENKRILKNEYDEYSKN